jgi:hypothetical protein
MLTLNRPVRKVKNFLYRNRDSWFLVYSSLFLKRLQDFLFLRYPRDFLYRKKENFLYSIVAKSDLLGLTYDNERNNDGAGAQLQRIYGIYAISRLLQVAYIHTPLAKIGYQGIRALESNSFDQNIIFEYNKKFHISSDINLPEEFEIRCLEDVSLKQLIQLKKEAEKNQKFILAKIREPYGITDAYPESYEVIKEVSPFSCNSSPSTIRIAVHVRRGDLFFMESHRMLPNEYYISVMRRISIILDKLKLNYEFELYTEIPKKTFTVSPLDYGLEDRLSSSVVVDPKSNRIEEFDSIPNLKKFINTDPIETFEGMSSAHILVISHSSFSYLASLLNREGIIMYHNFWHKPLKKWLTISDSGYFLEESFVEQLGRITNQSNLNIENVCSQRS